MTEIETNVKGLDEFNKKVEQIQRDVSGSPMREAMAKATILVTNRARMNPPVGSPVDRGALRASILPDVVVRDKVVTGIVGSKVEYAPYQELGTKPFWPPWTPIYEWALRVTKGNKARAGALAYSARLAIATRGIRAKRFLQRALEYNARRIYRLIGDAVGRIVRK